ncbi:MAG: hypothetical protein H8E11_01180 [Candidatus Cloacimonetes bacterium]|nr:hypothetical protein [Candidatus Cloacimonadota bacterium]
MKRVLILCILIIFISSLLAQTTTEQSTKSGKYSNLKKLKSEAEEEVKIEIRKPDNVALMPRTQTDYDSDMRLNVIDKFKKSNKLLY